MSESFEPSPAGWLVPAGVKPGWDWLPSNGARARLELMPVWVRVWYYTPLIDKYAYVWMWNHGGWEIPSSNDPDLRIPHRL